MPLEQRSSTKKNLLIVRTIAVFVALVGFLVIYGWVADIPQLTSLRASWVSMKFITAICFVLSGAILFLISSLLKSTSSIALTA